MYVFVNPLKPQASEGTPKDVTWEFAQKEVAQAKGFATGMSGLTKGNKHNVKILVEHFMLYHFYHCYM